MNGQPNCCFYSCCFHFSFLPSRVAFQYHLWAKSRFDLINVVEILSNIIRIIPVILFFLIIKPGIWQVGVGIFISALFGIISYYLLWKKVNPELYVAPLLFDRFRVRELFGMGGWIVVNQIGSLLFLNIDLIIANLVLGVKIAGEYGSILLFSTLLRGSGRDCLKRPYSNDCGKICER